MKKILLLFLFLLGALLFFLWPSPQKKESSPSPEKLLSLSIEGKEKELIALLNEKEELLLFRGAEKLINQDFLSAHSFLIRAEKNLSSTDSKVQASLLLALTAYFSQEKEAFFTHLAVAERRDLSRTDGTLLPTLAAFLKKENQKAKQGFLHPSERGDDLFALVSKKLFTPLWQESHLALLLLEEGEDGAAKELLEKRIDPLHLEKSEDAKLASFVLGLAHHGSALRLTGKDQEIAHKMALFFLEQAGSLNGFTQERARGARLLVENIKKNPDGRSLFAFLPYLERWQEKEAFESLACSLIEREKNMPELMARIPKGPFSYLLSKKIKERAVASIKNNSFDTDELLTLFGKEPLRAMQGEIEESILRSTITDMSKAEDLINLWHHFASDRKFLTTLLEQGKLFWRQEGKEKRGTRLFTLLLRYSNKEEKEESLKEINRFFTALFKDALRSNTVKRLLLIKEAIAELSIPCKISLTDEMIANTVEDSKYLFQVRNFAASQLAAKLALACDPCNQKALYLVGLSSFHMGEYKEALCALKRLANPDEDAKRALYLCQVEIQGDAIVQANREFSEEN